MDKRCTHIENSDIDDAPPSFFKVVNDDELIDRGLPSDNNVFAQSDEIFIRDPNENLLIKRGTLATKTTVLQNMTRDQRKRLEQTRLQIQETKRQLELEMKSNKSKEGKIELIKRYIASRKASVEKRRGAEHDLIDEIKQHASRKVFQLTTDIFPIEEINLSEQSTSFVNMETSPLLTFSDGSHHQIEQQSAHVIVEPWLPGNGDYSSYGLWVNENHDQVHSSVNQMCEINSASRIAAALAYTSQLVKNLAYYLDVTLPANMGQEIFSQRLLSDLEFSYNVAKLNTNIIHLCVSQGIDLSLLDSQKTLKNLLLLLNLNLSDLGRKPIMELEAKEEAAERIEDQLNKDLSSIQDSFYDFSRFVDDEDDISDSEWEISDNINLIEMQIANPQTIQQDSYISRLPMRLISSFWGTNS